VHDLLERFQKVGLTVPSIILPKADVDLEKWTVVACDQFTSEKEYWAQVESFVGDSPSALHLIFPEAYLGDSGGKTRIKQIREHMRNYLQSGTVSPLSPGFIYVDRKTPYTNSRKGLLVAIDLEEYDYNKGAETLVRATEGTILDRLPPRIKIREGATMELPHIMVLIDDPDKSIIEPLAAEAGEKEGRLQKLYDFDLMMNSGHLTGYLVNEEPLLTQVLLGLENLIKPDNYTKKYGIHESPLLFAVGDGNHSLATAKAVWERLKKSASDQKNILSHPARYALVELVNLYDEGLTFEPIHRVVFNVEVNTVFEAMKNYYTCEIEYINGLNISADLESAKTDTKQEVGLQQFGFITNHGAGIIKIKNPPSNLEVGTLQTFLDDFLATHQGSKVDYIHGAEVVTTLGSQPGRIGFYLPVMDKRDLFKTVILDGALPRKTFSMGEAVEKRFYLESRRIGD